MKVLNFIFGLLSVIGAFYCIFYPGLTFLNSGWIVTILLGMWGLYRADTIRHWEVRLDSNLLVNLRW